MMLSPLTTEMMTQSFGYLSTCTEYNKQEVNRTVFVYENMNRNTGNVVRMITLASAKLENSCGLGHLGITG